MGIKEINITVGDKKRFTFLTYYGTFSYLTDSKEWTYSENRRSKEEDCLRTTFFNNSVSCGVWKSIYELHIIYINTSFHDTYRMDFGKDHVRIHYIRFPVQVYHSDCYEMIGAEKGRHEES